MAEPLQGSLPPMARPRVAAGALFFDDSGRLLLVKPVYKKGWDVPGGYVEPGETPRQACIREVEEELGLALPVDELLVVDWAPHPAEGDKVLFLFDGGVLSDTSIGAMSLPADELQEAAFVEDNRLHTLMPGRLATRILEAIDARSSGLTRYLEHGQAPADDE